MWYLCHQVSILHLQLSIKHFTGPLGWFACCSSWADTSLMNAAECKGGRGGDGRGPSYCAIWALHVSVGKMETCNSRIALRPYAQLHQVSIYPNMAAGDVKLATSFSPFDSHVTRSALTAVPASRPIVVPVASASPQAPLGSATHCREMSLADASMPVSAVNQAAAAFVAPAAGVLGAAPDIPVPASDAATASSPVSEAGTLGAAPGTRIPAVNAAAPAALVIQGLPVSAAAPAGEAVVTDGDPDLHVINAAAAILLDLNQAHGLPPLCAAAGVPQAGLLLPHAAALVDLLPPNRTLVNPSGTGRVPFVIRRHAPGVCGVKLSEQHQPSGTSRGASNCAVPSLRDMSRAVILSSLLDTPQPGDSLFDLLPEMSQPYTKQW